MSAADQIWNRIIPPNEADLPHEVARYFLSLSFTQQDKDRYVELSRRQPSELNLQEKSELEMLIATNTLLVLLQAKARLSLNQHQPAA
jgi:dsDNA-specific endonuclease/ATPase MutS2